MLPNQKASVDRNMAELTEALERETPLLLSYLEAKGVISYRERDLMVKASRFCTEEVSSLLHTLKAKDNGFAHLITYLRADGKSTLADKLQNYANGETVATVNYNTKRSALEEFSQRLARYYKLNYSDFPTMGESTKHVKDVWVPLQIDGRRETHLNADRIDHVELLSRLKSDEHCNAALIKGDPGMGKTTLAKKIAYDWAITYGYTEAPNFSLVLAVPLRSAGKSTLFDQLAIDYCCSIGGSQLMKGINKEKLIAEIDKLESQLLVILDGLDEYTSYSESPFRDMFSGPFQHSSACSTDPPPMIPYKLIITSRPYACESVQMAFPLLRFVILPLEADHLCEFVQLYCETSHGVVKVTEYLKTKGHLVINVPLILSFICYLADSVQEIPTNMTSLYDSFIRQMLRRENRQDKLTESVNIQSWKDANVVKTTSELAYQGSVDSSRSNYEFSKSDLDKCHVTNDSFICGFLLHKFNFKEESLQAEFPHRSIQEFFAAVHCYQLMLSGRKDVLKEVNKMIISRDSLVGRFFFGICSKEGRFDQMTKWLKPSLRQCDMFQPALVINAFGSALSDCSFEQNFNIGQKLFDSAGNMGDYIINIRFEHFLPGVDYLVRPDQSSDDFKNGLHLSVLSGEDNRSTSDWFLADNCKSARFACVQHRLQQLLEEKFDQIDILILGYGSVNSSTSFESVKLSRTQAQSDSQIISETLVHQIQQLPPVVNFVITTEIDIRYTITTFNIRYGRALGLKLINFQFCYQNADKDELLSTVARVKLADLTLDKDKTENKIGQRWTIRKFKVTVDEKLSQSILIFSLMRLSLLRD